MSYCPEHGLEMTMAAESSVVVVYICPSFPEVWVYNGELGSYYYKETLDDPGDCPKCPRKGQPLVLCDGCGWAICPYCWAEHEFNAKCEADLA